MNFNETHKDQEIFAACLAALTAAGCASIQAYAVTDDPADYEAYLETLTDEQLMKIREKEQKHAELVKARLDGTYPVPLTSQMVDLPGFIIRQQETKRHCGSACIQAALLYIDDYSPTQSYIYSQVGEHFSQIPGFINKEQDIVEYIHVRTPWGTEITKFASYIDLDINTYDTPTFLRIETDGRNWPYEARDGHCVCAYGISTDLSAVHIADPYGKFCPVEIDFYYTRPITTLSLCTTAICW